MADNGSVEYNGLWEEEIEQLVDEVTDVPEFGEGKMAEELIIRIPQQTPVKAVERD